MRLMRVAYWSFARHAASWLGSRRGPWDHAESEKGVVVNPVTKRSESEQ